VKLSPIAKARVRLTIIAAGLIPLAMLARLAASGSLMEVVQRLGAKAWEAYEKTRGR
jgi:hypothetical protein